jgi:SpoVK/Ycf46/Vps4 family AAA+-type ATPase
VRKVFSRARAASPCVVFFDEIDAIGVARGGQKGASVNDRVLAQLLAELDGIMPLDGVVILAATNQPDVIDPALMRPGRIDRMLYVGPPCFEARCAILRIRMKKMSVAGDVDVEVISRLAEGFSGAETVSICQEAAMLAMEENVLAKCVSQKHFLEGVKIIKPSITRDVIKFYEDFGAARSQ